LQGYRQSQLVNSHVANQRGIWTNLFLRRSTNRLSFIAFDFIAMRMCELQILCCVRAAF
jgi:hypothetical protein